MIFPTTDMLNYRVVDERGNHGTQVFIFMVRSPSALNMFPAVLPGLDSGSGRLIRHQTRTRLKMI